MKRTEAEARGFVECEAHCSYWIVFWCVDVDGKLYHVHCAEKLRAIGVLPEYELIARARYLATDPHDRAVT